MDHHTLRVNVCNCTQYTRTHVRRDGRTDGQTDGILGVHLGDAEALFSDNKIDFSYRAFIIHPR